MRVREEAEDAILAGPPERQWHTSEILSRLDERSGLPPTAADKYVLNQCSALRQFPGG